MLELKNINKIYKTEGLSQKALDDISVNFRENEFVSVLGPSGSGKTTLLNIIGGLDHYDSGDLIINEISTKKYKDKDWDSYRNHRIGFVFQSYNLITHQSILRNVELALTLSGVSKKERVKRAKEALIRVGLKDHMKKRPNQLSGGEQQRVSIARALVNNPDILLADEPTGALDSKTSEQIMDLLKEVAKDKLVIMVTHNAEIAEKYSTRVIKLKDGQIIDDSLFYDGKKETKEEEQTLKKKNKKTSMNLRTALSLSLNNLMTKKGRTILTSFAGSIGIIGIALILSLSNGVQTYIDKTERETLSSYPLIIEKNTTDIESLLSSAESSKEKVKKTKCPKNKVCSSDDITNSPLVTFADVQVTNNLKDFGNSIKSNFKNINNYVQDIQYSYDLDLQIYSSNTGNGIIKVNPNSLNLAKQDEKKGTNDKTNMYGVSQADFNVDVQDVFNELIGNEKLLKGQYDILEGRMPQKFNEVVLIADKKGLIPASTLYALDLENRNELDKIINSKDKKLETKNYNYKDFINHKFKLVLNTDYYEKEYGVWIDKSNDINYMKKLLDKSIDIEIVGVLKVSNDAVEATSGFVGYNHDLVEYVLNHVNDSKIAKEQLANKKINVFTNTKFDGVTSTYESNLYRLGINQLDEPTTISIYPKDYDSKDKIKDIIKKYNKGKKTKDKIVYTDYVAVLMKGITTVVNVITYVLIAFVAISLIVSSIMIAIITYISVLERVKEIGILRAIGASKKDVSRVFKAETIIEGLVAGALGILVTLLLLIPINMIVESLTKVKDIAKLPLAGAIALIIISVLLTVFAGLIPSKMAAKKDPVEALRTE